ncbi:SPOR domain-containing protein [Legionella oakridgensis]|uniref:Cell division protein n=2 Tax=Legionella oakridgensis TaxID=29423 RepID=W0BDD7_9GAMM|nr:SPOR domain-containing protein [Legionella oakridgensis]AHE67865.1 cell division protein [Legionella oakridgensis ATCC 33761 = DSM 21215]ETO92501.1 cell division protein [Legionella oakridgensis RV-2-2007]KTD38690.1 Sporulation domain-containing protein [Legionella oakridgensis]STY20874.1 Sporulation domain-containing protein [Legionella longbeachae]
MAKDYRKKGKSSSNGWLRQMTLVLMSFFCGYLSASLFNFTQASAWVEDHFFSKHKEQAISQPSKQQAQLPRPKLEFYTLLAKEQSAVPSAVNPQVANAINTSSNTAAKASATTAKVVEASSAFQKEMANKPATEKVTPAVVHKESYLVQVASFRKREDAERMKASLILKGFSVNVMAVVNQQIHWYRVIIGPFSSRIQAEKAQVEVARSEHITGMIRKMDA